MSSRMQQRRGTEAQWASFNPVLFAGEIGYATDTGLIKIGDGVKTWTQLTTAYIRKAGGDIIVASGAGVVPLAVQAAVGQTADLFQAKNSSGVNQVKVTSAGVLYVEGATYQVATRNYVDNLNGLNIQKYSFDATGDLLAGTGNDSFARIPIGVAGTVLTVVNGSLAWVAPAGGGGAGEALVRKTASTSRVSTTAMAADPDLKFTSVQAKLYRIRAFLKFAEAGMDARINFTGVSTSISKVMATLESASGDQILPIPLSSTGLTVSYNMGGDAILDGIVYANGTLISLTWAQTTSSSAPTVLEAGSYLTYQDVS